MSDRRTIATATLAIFSSVVATGCGAESTEAVEVEPQPAELRCIGPTEDLDVVAECRTLPENYGLVPELPLEWGVGNASGGVLYMNRLICPGGAEPMVARTGSIGTHRAD